MGRSAAGYVYGLLKNSHKVGITWGSTLSSVIEGIGLTNAQPLQQRIMFVPVCAELTGSTAIEFSSSRLADRFNEIFNDREGERLSLCGVPAFVSRRYKTEEKKVIWKYVRDSASYTNIFYGKEPIVNSLDTLITSVGRAENPLGHRNTELTAAGNIKPALLKTLIYGDIGGVLIPKENLNSGSSRKVKELNDMWTGIRLENLNRIAVVAQSQNTPGNIVLATGASKAPIIHELVHQGIINELIIDEDLKNALEAVLEKH